MSLPKWIYLNVVASVVLLNDVTSFPPPTPPTFPPSFNCSFQEIEVLGNTTLSTNNGSWYYDFANRRARFDHGVGQTNNFCGNQELSPKDPKAACSLLFTPSEDMYVHYPDYDTCCRLCGKEEGCTILKPDWLKTGTKIISVEIINGVECFGFAKEGAVAAEDVLYAGYSGIPCRYHEVVAHIDHNLTFIESSFKWGPQPDYLFDVPKYCNRTCPHPYHPPHGKLIL